MKMMKITSFSRLYTLMLLSSLPRHGYEIIKELEQITKAKPYEIKLDHEKILKIVQRGSKAEVRHKTIKELFQTYKKLTRSQIVEITDMNPGMVSKELGVLSEKGFIKKIKPTNSVKSHYFIFNETE